VELPRRKDTTYFARLLNHCCHGNATKFFFNPLKAELNFICHLLALLGTHHVLNVSGVRVNIVAEIKKIFLLYRLYQYRDTTSQEKNNFMANVCSTTWPFSCASS
jgi:hypothetical protein